MAFAKAEEVKQIAVQNVKAAARNIQDTEKLQEHSENIKLLIKDFDK